MAADDIITKSKIRGGLSFFFKKKTNLRVQMIELLA